MNKIGVLLYSVYETNTKVLIELNNFNFFFIFLISCKTDIENKIWNSNADTCL